MAHRTHIAAAGLAAAAITGASLLAPPASAASKTATVQHVSTIPWSLGGKKVDTYDVSVIRQLDRIGKGGAAYVAAYSIGPDSADVVDALIGSADGKRKGVAQRGGKVYLLTWRQNGGNQDEEGELTSTQLKRLEAYLDAHPKVGWFKDCIGGCRRKGTVGIQHVKMWAFDFGNGTYAVEQGGGNSTGDTDRKAFNEFDILSGPGVKPMFDQYVRYITTSRADKNLGDIPDAVVPIKDGTARSRVFPNKRGDLMFTQLAASRGYKPKKGEPGCHIVIDQFKVTVNKLDLYDHAIRLKREGCQWVEVDLNWRGDNAVRFESKVQQMKAAGVVVYDGSYSPKYPDAHHYDHQKRAGGVVKDSKGRIVRWSVNGSLTASASATSNSSEQQILYISAEQAQHVFDRQAQMRPYLRRM